MDVGGLVGPLELFGPTSIAHRRRGPAAVTGETRYVINKWAWTIRHGASISPAAASDLDDADASGGGSGLDLRIGRVCSW